MGLHCNFLVIGCVCSSEFWNCGHSAFAFEWSVPSGEGGRFPAHSSISRICETDLSPSPLRKLLFTQTENKMRAW